MGITNEGRCCDAVIQIIENRERSVRQICSIDTVATPGVDVRCRIGTQIYALEHTTLDPYPERRADDQRFLDVLQPVASSIEAMGLLRPDRRYKLLVDVHAFRRISKSALVTTTAQLKAWVIDNLDGLDPRDHGRAAVCWGGPPDLSVRILLQCFNARGSLRGKISLARLVPENLEDLRGLRIRETIAKKGPKLHAEHVSGSIAVLVLEELDLALSNEMVIADLVHCELDESGFYVDEVYLVDTTSTTEWMSLLLKRGSCRWPTENECPPMWSFDATELSDLTSR